MPDSGFSRPDENSTASGVLTPAAAPSTVYRRIRLSGKLRPSCACLFHVVLAADAGLLLPHDLVRQCPAKAL